MHAELPQLVVAYWAPLAACCCAHSPASIIVANITVISTLVVDHVRTSWRGSELSESATTKSTLRAGRAGSGLLFCCGSVAWKYERLKFDHQRVRFLPSRVQPF